MTDKVPIREGIFQKGPDGYNLIAGKCGSCGQVFFPRIQTCLSCRHETVNELKLGKRGRLFSYTVTQMPALNFPPPFAVGFIDLTEGVRVFSQLCMVEEKPFQVGMEMELEIDVLWTQEDKSIMGYRFSPV